MERQRTQRTILDELSAVAIIAAPILLLASAVTSALGQGVYRDQAGGVIQVYAFAAFVPAIIGLTRLLEPAFPRVSALLTVLGAMGTVAGAGYGVEHIQFGVTGVEAQRQGTFGLLALMVPGISFFIALFGIGLSIVRAGVEPRWCGLVLSLSAILFPVSNIGQIEILRVASASLLLLALAPIGWRLLERRSAVSVGSLNLPGEA